jgi:hypothetical protein
MIIMSDLHAESSDQRMRIPDEPEPPVDPWPPPPPPWEWTVKADPDVVGIGTTVRLTAVRTPVGDDATAAVGAEAASTWSLSFVPRGSQTARNEDGLLSATTGTSTSFVASGNGIYHASFIALGAPQDTADIDSGPSSVAVAVRSDPDQPDHQRVFYTWWRLGQGGSGWHPVDLPGETFRTDAAPAVTAVGNYLFLLAKSLDGELWLNQGEVGKPFVGWQPAGIRTDVGAAVTTTTDTP